jgi:hypothetical protein
LVPSRCDAHSARQAQNSYKRSMGNPAYDENPQASTTLLWRHIDGGRMRRRELSYRRFHAPGAARVSVSHAASAACGDGASSCAQIRPAATPRAPKGKNTLANKTAVAPTQPSVIVFEGRLTRLEPARCDADVPPNVRRGTKSMKLTPQYYDGDTVWFIVRKGGCYPTTPDRYGHRTFLRRDLKYTRSTQHRLRRVKDWNVCPLTPGRPKPHL